MSLYVGDIAFSITNHSVTLLIVFVFAFIIPVSIINKKDRSILIVPNVPQPGLKLIYSYVMKYTNILREKCKFILYPWHLFYTSTKFTLLYSFHLHYNFSVYTFANNSNNLFPNIIIGVKTKDMLFLTSFYFLELEKLFLFSV